MSLILVVGNLTLDIINQVEHYPAEDEELRVLQQRVQSGGNAANTAQVLVQYQHQVELAAVLGQDAAAEFLNQALARQQLDTQPLRRAPGQTPTSYITLNRQTGSRTIVHYRQLAELDQEDMQSIEFSRYDWIHFEGRNVALLAQLLPRLQQRFDQVVSLEIEKDRPGLTELIEHVDVVMFSRAYALSQDFGGGRVFLQEQHRRHPVAILSCTWGGQGAYAVGREGTVLFEPALSSTKVVDTLGAGDTFNAGLIHSLVTGFPLSDALQQAVLLAGKKVSQHGLANLVVPV